MECVSSRPVQAQIFHLECVRLHYQTYLEARGVWDEDRKNKLTRFYEGGNGWISDDDRLALRIQGSNMVSQRIATSIDQGPVGMELKNQSLLGFRQPGHVMR